MLALWHASFLAFQSENSSTQVYSHIGKTCLWLTCWDCFPISYYEWRILSSIMWRHALWYWPTWHHITDDCNLHTHCHENYKLHIAICVQMKVLPAASQFIGVWHLAVALQAVGRVPPHPHANSQSLLMERRPVHAHALQQDLSVQVVGLLPGKAKTVNFASYEFCNEWHFMVGIYLKVKLSLCCRITMKYACCHLYLSFAWAVLICFQCELGSLIMSSSHV